MFDFLNPAVAAFLKLLGSPTEFIEVLISPQPTGFELRHRADLRCDPAALQYLPTDALTAWADFSSTGAFRPNKAAPNLRSGWRCQVNDGRELEAALDSLYPGALADWYATQTGTAAAFSLRDFTVRQTGLYRAIQKLTVTQVGEVTCAVCHPQFCQRQRRWEIPEAPGDAPETKSMIPCWEPCALWLEFARRAARVADEEPVAWQLRPSEVESVIAAFKLALAAPDSEIREGDSSRAGNPRRLRQLMNRFLASSSTARASKEI